MLTLPMPEPAPVISTFFALSGILHAVFVRDEVIDVMMGLFQDGSHV